MARKSSTQLLSEMKQFAAFTASEQRYIRRSLDVGFGRGDASARWARGPNEALEIEVQARRYRLLDPIRACIPDDSDPGSVEPILAPLISIVAADLQDGKLVEFEAFAFLYERLMGPAIRPWLVSAFCAAAALPSIHPELRAQLLQSIPVADAAARGWSIRQPLFYPEWVDKVEEVVG